jgi:hypothetical protein
MQNFAVVIALYIPVSLSVGWLLGQLAIRVESSIHLREPIAGQVIGQGTGAARGAGSAGADASVDYRACPARSQRVVAVAFLATALLAATRQVRVVDPAHIMVTRPDMRAMAWIRENTPPEALFLVEGFRIYGGRSAVGADAGWWLPLLAGRRNTMPPQYALVNEVPLEPDYGRRVVDLVAHLESESPASPGSIELLCDWGVTHVYVGQGQGKVGAGAVQLFSPQDFRASSAFRTVYHRDRVHIFALDPQLCGAAVE